ncbi:MAG: FkbM family methyltransferase [Pedobacter sp.]|nr:MAG: FkbM family methyltransferase [Pedobacter sp.]
MFKTKSCSLDGQLYSKTSYSQSGEDLIVEFIFNQLGIFKPSYIDIGAHHPFYLSNTAIFYKKGCRGINIEPDPELFAQFEIYRKDDINLNIGIGDKPDFIDFFIMNVPTLNTFSPGQVAAYKNEGNYFVKSCKKVEIETIENILAKNNGIFPDFLSLDAEGIDELVLRSIDFTNKPKIICVETLSFSNSGKGVKNTALIDFVIENGYILYADTHINSIFVSEELWENQ